VQLFIWSLAISTVYVLFRNVWPSVIIHYTMNLIANYNDLIKLNT